MEDGLSQPLLAQAAGAPGAPQHPQHPQLARALSSHPVAVVIEDYSSDDEPAARAPSFFSRRSSRTSALGDTAPADTYSICVFNFTKVILGAGMMAVPRAFYLLGVVPGTALMAGIGWLTHVTLARGLVACSDQVGAKSYGALARRVLGGRAEAALQLAVFANCWAMLVVFLVIIGDVLIGTAPDYYGLIRQLTGATGGPALSRPAVLGALSAAVLLPLGSMRSMERLAAVNIIGVAANALFALLMLALAMMAVATGAAQPLPLFPQWSALAGGDRRPSSLAGRLLGLAPTLPIILNCFTAHQSLHPLLPSLRPYSTARARSMVAASLGLAGALYYTISICSCLVFGASLHDDVLADITVATMTPLLRYAAAARAAALAVRVGYLLSVAGSFVLLLFPLRHVIADVALGGHDALAPRWVPVTAVLIGSAYCTACYLPSIWGALSFVGATATTTQAWIVPALVMLALERAAPGAAAGAPKRGGAAAAAARRAVAGVILVVGVLMFANAVVGEVLPRLAGGGA